MNLPAPLLQYLRNQGAIYWPGVGMIKLVRVSASYGIDGSIVPPQLVLQRSSIGANLSTEDTDFYRQHPQVLDWIQKHAAAINAIFEREQNWRLLNHSSHTNALPSLKSTLPVNSGKVLQLEPFNWKRVAVVALILVALFGSYQKLSVDKLSAFLGFGAIGLADFKEDLASVKSTNRFTEIEANPYFKQIHTKSEAFVLVSGVFSKEENARKWMEFLTSKGLEAAIIPGPSGLFRVCSLPIPTDFEAVHLMDEWQKNYGIHTWVLPI